MALERVDGDVQRFERRALRRPGSQPVIAEHGKPGELNAAQSSRVQAASIKGGFDRRACAWVHPAG